MLKFWTFSHSECRKIQNFLLLLTGEYAESALRNTKSGKLRKRLVYLIVSII